MSELFVCPLASGSKANSILIVSPEAKILIDAGLSARALEQRLAAFNLSLSQMDAVFVTHEHSDHIQHLPTYSSKFNLPVVANSQTARAIVSLQGGIHRFQVFTTAESFTFKDLEVFPFSISHDAADPVGFTIQCGGRKLGFCADLGFVSSGILAALQKCDLLYLEANHEPALVHACSRPMLYKQRVLSRSGHLSNEAMANALKAVVWDGLQHVWLAHLSSECNVPEKALQAAAAVLAGTQTTCSIAYQEQSSKSASLALNSLPV